MALTYFKRYDMELDLRRWLPPPTLPAGYHWVGWDESLLRAHAETKYRSFRSEIDASVFPCLGDLQGCLRLMNDISNKEGFMPTATWLVAYQRHLADPVEYCGTIQGIRDATGTGAVQNLGVVPGHRSKSLGRQLILQALMYFQAAGLERAFLQVTARNDGAIRLYEKLGFTKIRTLYKVVDMAYAT